MDSSPHIAQLLESLESLSQFKPTVVATEQDARHIQFAHETKVVVLLWPNKVCELFLDFIQDGVVLLAESLEYYDGETQDEAAEDVARIVRNYLLNEVRVVQPGRLLKRQELQVLQGGKWSSVFETAAQ